MANYPNTKQLGSVVNVDGHSLPKIDLLLGGSPCQSFSFAGKRKGMSTKCETEILTLDHYLELKNDGYEFEGQSYLFWEYMRLLNECKPTYFLLENVEMGEKWEKVLSKAIGVNGIHINSALVSAQNRKRIYWTNIGLEPSGLFGDLESIIEQPKDRGILLKDILQDNPCPKTYLSKKEIEVVLGKKHQQDEINFVDGKARTLVSGSHGNAKHYTKTIIPVDEKYFLSEKTINRITKSDFGKDFRNPNTDKATPLLMNYYKQGNDGNYIIDKQFIGLDFNAKSRTIRNGGSATATDKHNWDLIVHNTMPRSSTSGKGGTGPLSRADGKTYCLDTGNTNAVEVKNNYIQWDSSGKGNNSQGERAYFENGKSGTLSSGSKNSGQVQPKVLVTNAVEIRQVKQISTNNKSNGATQPYQQDRIYDVDGISPALNTDGRGHAVEIILTSKDKRLKQTIDENNLVYGEVKALDVYNQSIHNRYPTLKDPKHNDRALFDGSRIRRLTPIECERLQTVADNYTNHVSDSQRYKMLGNGWTIEVIAHILNYAKF
jgi:site-specific DNA-cytosine methylase